jgi:hypothetical protein
MKENVMIKAIILTLTLVAASTSFADPQKRYVGRNYTCAELQDILQEDGELNLVHRIGYGTTYPDKDRCDELPYRAEAVPVWEKASDTNRCFVGYRCWIHGNAVID